MDNYGTHKTKAIRDWFAKRPRWQAHFTPSSASWLNQIERWSGLLTDKQIRSGVHRSTKDLERTSLDYIDTTNQNLKPFKWTKSADDILDAIQRFGLRTIEIAEQQAKIMSRAIGPESSQIPRPRRGDIHIVMDNYVLGGCPGSP